MIRTILTVLFSFIGFGSSISKSVPVCAVKQALDPKETPSPSEFASKKQIWSAVAVAGGNMGGDYASKRAQMAQAKNLES